MYFFLSLYIIIETIIIKPKYYISIFALLLWAGIQAQVKIEGELHIAEDAVMVISGQDVTVDGEIKGEGHIILKDTKDKKAKVTYHGKELNNDDLEIASMRRKEFESIEPKTYLADHQSLNLESVLVKKEEKKELVIPKVGSLLFTRIVTLYQDNNLPIGALPIYQSLKFSPEILDNYFIQNNNYTTITKEPIVSSQNLHDTILVKSTLDPPKSLI